MQIVTVSGHQAITEDRASQLLWIFPKTSEDECPVPACLLSGEVGSILETDDCCS